MYRRAFALLMLLSIALLGFVQAEQIESLGPQLVADGSFISGDGREPQRPAGWAVDEQTGGSALWQEQGNADKGSAKLGGDGDASRIVISQRRWLFNSNPCYLLTYCIRGKGDLQMALRLFNEKNPDLCTVRRTHNTVPGWIQVRAYFEPYPSGLDGELDLSFRLSGTGSFDIDNVSLTRYEGPYTRRTTSYDTEMPVAPTDGTRVSGAAMLTWRGVPFAKKYIVRLSDGKRETVYERTANCCLVPVAKGENSWRVTCVGEDGIEYDIVPTTLFISDTAAARPPIAPASGSPAPPGYKADYDAWRSSGIAKKLFPIFTSLPVPTLAVTDPPAGVPGEATMFDLNTRWQTAADLLCRLATLEACGEAPASGTRELLKEASTFSRAAAPYLAASTRSQVVLACCKVSAVSPSYKGACSEIASSMLPNATGTAALCGLSALDYDLYRLLAATFLASRHGLVNISNSEEVAEMLLALGVLWFPASGSPLGGALLASDYPLFQAAFAELAKALTVAQTKQLPAYLDSTVRNMIADFPLNGRSGFCDTVTMAEYRTASVLSYLCGSTQKAVPAWALTGLPAKHVGYMGLLPLAQEYANSAPSYLILPEAGLAFHGSPLLVGEPAFSARASRYGTAPPFSAAQGSFSLFWKNTPLAGLSPDCMDGFPMRLADPWRSQSLKSTIWAGQLSAYSPTPAADATIERVRACAGGMLVECDLTSTAVDQFRSCRRFIAYVARPGRAPLVLCHDKFSTWFHNMPVIALRLNGKMTIDKINQRAVSELAGMTLECLAAYPAGCNMWPSGGPAIPSPTNRNDIASTFCVMPPAGSRDSLVALTVREGTQNILAPLSGDDSRAVAVGTDGICAFAQNEGASYMAGGILTDAAFFAWLPLDSGRIFVLAFGATTMDKGGKIIFEASKPVTLSMVVKADDFAAIEVSAAPGDAHVKTANGLEFDCSATGYEFGTSDSASSPRLKKDLFNGDSVEKILAVGLPGGRAMHIVPMSLSGIYSVEASLVGEKGKSASLRFGTEVIQVAFEDGRTRDARFCGDYRGPANLVVVTDEGIRFSAVTVEKRFLSNGGFEEWEGAKPAGYFFEPDNLPVARDEKEKSEGKCSLCVTLPKDAEGSVFTTINAPERSYSVSVRVRIEAAKDNDMFATLVLTPLDAAGKPVGSPSVSPAMGSQRTWKQIKQTIRMPKEAIALKIEIRLKGQGSAWLDEVVVSQ